MDYRVCWEIDIPADSPQAAAREARRIQLDPTSRSTVFDVIGADDSHERVDLDDDLVEED